MILTDRLAALEARGIWPNPLNLRCTDCCGALHNRNLSPSWQEDTAGPAGSQRELEATVIAPMDPKEVMAALNWEMGRECYLDGLDQREHGSQMITVAFYSIHPQAGSKWETRLRKRVALFIDGIKSTGLEVDA